MSSASYVDLYYICFAHNPTMNKYYIDIAQRYHCYNLEIRRYMDYISSNILIYCIKIQYLAMSNNKYFL